jgi:cobaltochelatase CobN
MTTFHSYENWKRDIQGLHFMELSSNVIWPEYDGQIIAVPMATMETEDSSGAWRKEPITERVNKVARIAKSYALLKRTPPSERKIANNTTPESPAE